MVSSGDDQMSDSIDYARVANLYDAYVRTTFDVPFFLKEAKKTEGQVLELMSGTGRVSLPLVEAGIQLTCVDNSREMLSVLRAKLRQRGLNACTHQMDVRELDLAERFELIIIPFHSFSEILSPADQQKTMLGIHRHLTETGRFICTLHNPPVRLKRVDGQLRLWDKSRLEKNNGSLLLWGQEEYAADRRTVNLLEFLEEYDAHGVMQSRTLLEMAYCPLGKIEFQQLAELSGFRVLALYGNYDYAEFQDETSPFMIWVLEKIKAS
jgi:SAM-dependent methyltransferase